MFEDAEAATVAVSSIFLFVLFFRMVEEDFLVVVLVEVEFDDLTIGRRP